MSIEIDSAEYRSEVTGPAGTVVVFGRRRREIGTEEGIRVIEAQEISTTIKNGHLCEAEEVGSRQLRMKL